MSYVSVPQYRNRCAVAVIYVMCTGQLNESHTGQDPKSILCMSFPAERVKLTTAEQLLHTQRPPLTAFVDALVYGPIRVRMHKLVRR